LHGNADFSVELSNGSLPNGRRKQASGAPIEYIRNSAEIHKGMERKISKPIFVEK